MNAQDRPDQTFPRVRRSGGRTMQVLKLNGPPRAEEHSNCPPSVAGSSPAGSRGEPATMGAPTRLKSTLLLLVCVAGIYGSYLTQGVVQETLSTKKFGADGARFSHLSSLNAVQCWVCFLWAGLLLPLFDKRCAAAHCCLVAARGPAWRRSGSALTSLQQLLRALVGSCAARPVCCDLQPCTLAACCSKAGQEYPPFTAYWRAAVTNCVGPACGLHALKYISYPAQVPRCVRARRGKLARGHHRWQLKTGQAPSASSERAALLSTATAAAAHPRAAFNSCPPLQSGAGQVFQDDPGDGDGHAAARQAVQHAGVHLLPGHLGWVGAGWVLAYHQQPHCRLAACRVPCFTRMPANASVGDGVPARACLPACLQRGWGCLGCGAAARSRASWRPPTPPWATGCA